MNGTKKWRRFKPHPELSSEFSRVFKISPPVSQILINRGFDSEEAVKRFFSPKLNSLSDPRSIPGVTAAARRLMLARERNEKVTVYGDYDVDGVTGTAILLDTLRFLNIRCDYYIPHRYVEGYGLNRDSVASIKAAGADLLVTVDCGISNFEEVAQANSLGMDVIVSDHHNIPDRVPEAVSVVNPKLIKEKHPSRELSGSGVAFKLAWALLREAGIKDSGMILSLLDLACLGTIADVVPLIEENRVIALAGLQVITSRSRLGLRALIDSAGLKGNITANMVNFCIAPRINAAGRLEHASLALELLLADDEKKAREMAASLGKINQKRQGIGSKIQQEIFALAKADVPEKRLLLYRGEDWHPGVIGIVASRVVETFHRPTVLIGMKDGVGRGSARSFNGINIFEILDSCRDLFVDFGGHENAAGFEISGEKIDALEKRLAEEAEKRIEPSALSALINIDMELDPSDITMALIKELDALAPFGKGNEEPVFMTRNLKMVNFKLVGDNAHLKARFSDGRNNLDVIGFGMADIAGSIGPDSLYDIAYTLRVSEWEGFECAELRLLDLKESSI